MTVTAITNATATAGAIGGTTPKANSLGQADFLKLLTTQLTTQDPFNPTDNTQMIAQMAQFSQVTGIAEINQSLGNIASMLSQGRQSDLASWIGKSALVTSSAAAPMADGYIRGEVTVGANASDMTVAFLDASGNVLGEQPLQPDANGGASFAWESNDPSAVVNLQVRRAGQAVEAPTKIWTSVIALSDPASANPGLLTTSGKFSAQDVERLG